jgi:hypothetical protein
MPMSSRAGADFRASLSRSPYEFRLGRSYTTNHGELLEHRHYERTNRSLPAQAYGGEEQRENRQFNPKRIDLLRRGRRRSGGGDRHLPSTASSSPRRSRRPFSQSVTHHCLCRALCPDRYAPIANYGVPLYRGTPVAPASSGRFRPEAAIDWWVERLQLSFKQ